MILHRTKKKSLPRISSKLFKSVENVESAVKSQQLLQPPVLPFLKLDLSIPNDDLVL
jgi:hypothetical protein